jgi:hypothetical protein
MTEAWAAPDDITVQDRLATAFPSWEVWQVPLWPLGTTWCARLRSDHKLIIRESSPAELAQMLDFLVTRRCFAMSHAGAS